MLQTHQSDAPPQPPSLIHYFDTYEAREAAFETRVGELLPTRLRGPRVFWRTFSRITNTPLDNLVPHTLACITSNPRDSLVFGTPEQVLLAACQVTSGQKARNVSRIEQAITHFDLQPLLRQPLRSLSGGETVRLALAKMFLLLPRIDSLIIASPFSWLSYRKLHYLDVLLKDCEHYSCTPELLALAGEDDPRPFRPEALPKHVFRPAPEFKLVCDNLKIELGLALDALFKPSPKAQVMDAALLLQSPCLLHGENGQGKSLIAKALAGAVTIQGVAELQTEPAQCGPRLLFQDVISQTLLRSFSALAGNAQSSSELLYHKLKQAIREIRSFEAPNDQARKDTLITNSDTNSLLNLKLMLTATRLACQPAALILDEPDWGLSRRDALAFTGAVIAVAHCQGTPVLLISHKPWWPPLMKSFLYVQRHAALKTDCCFAISVNPDCGAISRSESGLKPLI